MLSTIILTASLLSTVYADINAPLHLLKRQAGAAACSSFLSKDSDCSASTPGFGTLALTSELKCYCSSGGSYAGGAFDSNFAGCYAYLSTAAPTAYSSLKAQGIPSSPCAAYASYTATAGGAATTSGATATTGGVGSPITSVTNSNQLACATFAALESSCDRALGATTLGDLASASCLCYSGTSYVPTRYDSALQGCLSYYKTASPAFYSSVTAAGIVTTPCAAVGNVRQTVSSSGSSSSSTSSSRSSSSTTASPTSDVVVTVTQQPSSTSSRNVGGTNNSPVGWSFAVVLNALMAMLL